MGGEVFTAMDEPSDRCALWGELFKEKERHFYRKELTCETVCFSIKDTFQINVRCLWQPQAKQLKHRQGPFAMLLHSLEPPLTSSWTWVKLGRPLYMKGFSVVMIDFPGFGRSKMNMDSSVALDVWAFQDWHLICQTLDELKVHSAHMIACGHACGAVLRILLRSPHSVEKEMIWYNPKFNIDELLIDMVGPPPPGGGKGWREVYRQKQVDAMERILKNTNARIWSMHDKDHLTAETIDVQSLLASVCRHAVLRHRILIQDVSPCDLCPVHMGAQLPFFFLFISKQLTQAIMEFFQKRERNGQMLLAMPRFVSNDPLIVPLGPDETWSAAHVSERNPAAKGGFATADPLKWGFSLGPKGESLMEQRRLSRSSRSGTKLAPLVPKEEEEVTPEEQDNPLIKIMRKARPQTTAASLDERGLAAPVDVYGCRAATAGAMGVAMARWRKGQDAYEQVRYTSCTQTKHPVREIQDRDEVSMLSASQEAFNLNGGKQQAGHFRLALLSKLNTRQRRFVMAHQTPEVESTAGSEIFRPSDQDEQGSDGSPRTPGSKPSRTVSRQKMQPALSQGSGDGTPQETMKRSISATALKDAVRSASRQNAIENKESMKSLPGPSSLRSKSNLSASSGGRKGPQSGAIGDLRSEKVEPLALTE